MEANEHVNFIFYPFSHSFAGVLIWAVLFGAAYFVFRNNLKNALLLGALVLSHWFLDLIVHRPDLPLAPGSALKVGLGVWNSVILTLVLESAIFVGGAWIYVEATRAVNKAGSLGLWGLLVILAVVYVMNGFGPPPKGIGQIAFATLSMWILVIWAYWVDRNRRLQTE